MHNYRLWRVYCLIAVWSLGWAVNVLAADKVTVLIENDKPGATIHRNIYGQFMEHLGRGIYEGVWVGENSDIPNTRGFRKDTLQALKALDVPLLRWPGGCFADEYHWRDGIGPRDERPVTVNTNWGGVTEDNAFGTHEFFEFAELLDAEVYINGNLGTGTVQEMADWLEYMTSDSDSTLANLRRKNGRDQPWRVDYFAIGNESWGCGGNMTPDYYSDLYKHYASFLKTPEDNQPVMIASGGHTEITEWTETLLKKVPESWNLRMNAISHHYYTLPTGQWDAKGKALGFDEQAWFETLRNTLRIDEYIRSNIAIMDRYDPEQEVGFYVDEWGTWYDPAEGDDPGFLYQQNSLRDALVAAVNLNIFHGYAERIKLTNIAQMVNVLQAMILTDKEKMLLTPTYHVYKMYKPFHDATHLPHTVMDAPRYERGEQSIPQLSVSAAKTADGQTVLALSNLHPHKTLPVAIQAADGNFDSARGQVLTAEAIDAHNTFDAPEQVVPRDLRGRSNKKTLLIDLPAKSVAVLRVQ